MNEFLVLDEFEEYLIKKRYKEYTLNGDKSTTYDYSHIRIPFVLKEEKISIEKLMMDIDYYVSIYDIGGKKEKFGKKSHRSVINALKRFHEFLLSECYKNNLN